MAKIILYFVDMLEHLAETRSWHVRTQKCKRAICGHRWTVKLSCHWHMWLRHIAASCTLTCWFLKVPMKWKIKLLEISLLKRAFNAKDGIFLSMKSFFLPDIFKFLLICKWGTDDVTRCVYKTKHISGKNGAMLWKLCIEIWPHIIHDMVHNLLLPWQ